MRLILDKRRDYPSKDLTAALKKMLRSRVVKHCVSEECLRTLKKCVSLTVPLVWEVPVEVQVDMLPPLQLLSTCSRRTTRWIYPRLQWLMHTLTLGHTACMSCGIFCTNSPPEQRKGHLAKTLCCTTGLTMQPLHYQYVLIRPFPTLTFRHHLI